MSDSMDATRRQLRRFLIPATQGAATDEHDFDDGDHFPRSKVMRFVFNPRNRKLLKFSAPILGVLVTRVVGAGRLSVVSDIARSLSRNKN